tara:strand:- start:69 stop:770 length:702 start_codon:yes stop_codon:yes gene_type:complete
MKKILILLFIFISPTIFANSISDCKIISDDTERLQCYDSLSVEITQQEENSKVDSVSNLKEEGIFFQIISKEKIKDANGEEACLTDFVVTNNSKYTIQFTDEFPWIHGVNSDYTSQYLFLVNPYLVKTEVEPYDESIKYFERGMTANLQNYYQTVMGEFELSKLVHYEKCKRVKKYTFLLMCGGLETVLDANEDEIEWKSKKEAYETIHKISKPHPDHDKKEFGKILFKKGAC